MVNTLRITSIVAVVVAGLVLLVVVGPQGIVPKVLAGFALQSNQETQRILGEPGAVEQWRDQHGNTKAVDRDATPVLVKQAELLTKILNPPAPLEPKTDPRHRIDPHQPVVTKTVNSAKFDLVGTSCEPDNPQGSFAYVHVKGDNTYQWVQIGDEIGHYTVKEVQPDAVVCFDGKTDVKVEIQSSNRETSSLLEEGEDTTAATADTGAESIRSAASHAAPGRITGRPVPDAWKRTAAPAGPGAAALRQRAETDRRARELVERMREAGQADPGSKLEDRAARVKRLISEFKSSQVGPNETKKVEDLGRELNRSN